MQLFAYNWKLPAYNGAFLLPVDKFSFFAYSWSFFTYILSLFAYSGKVRLIGALRDCKQRSLTVRKKTPTVTEKASLKCFYIVFWGVGVGVPIGGDGHPLHHSGCRSPLTWVGGG